jgi:hypothetical protein
MFGPVSNGWDALANMVFAIIMMGILVGGPMLAVSLLVIAIIESVFGVHIMPRG